MNFAKNSFIVNNKLQLAIVDKRIPKNMETNLNNMGVSIIKSTCCSNTYEAIKYHPDISVCKLNDNNIVVAPNVYNYYKDVLKPYGFNVICGDSIIKNKYPYNIHYNIVILKNFAIHNFKYTDKVILSYLEKNNIKKINVSQGYCKCSICIVDDNSLITSDEGIYKEVIKYGIDCLLIEKGHSDLFELNYGFIGGCSFLLSSNELVFLGNIRNHPDYDKIVDFVESKNKKLVSLSDDKLLDLGSVIPLLEY